MFKQRQRVRETARQRDRDREAERQRDRDRDTERQRQRCLLRAALAWGWIRDTGYTYIYTYILYFGNTCVCSSTTSSSYSDRFVTAK